MPRRKEKPGFKRGRHGLPYWLASQLVPPAAYREIKDVFPDPCIPLPPDAGDDDLKALCLEHTARLDAWLDLRKTGDAAEPGCRYDGTVAGLCDLYERHPSSPFREVRQNTARTYLGSLKIVRSTVGARRVRNVTVPDVRRWFGEWRKPARDGEDERLKRAKDAVDMVRSIMRFGASLRLKECAILADELAKVRFEKPGAREQEMTYLQAAAFVRTALELGARGAVPGWRGRYMAIGVAAQWELALRQKDIIGEWLGDEWRGPFTWESIPGWRLRLKTSKTRAAAVFTLSNYPLLFPLLDAVPHAERTGAIVKGEHGLPVRERSYRKWFRQIARAAGIPDEVWSMDSRAGAATEADEAGADLATISDMLTHAEPRTTVRYLRRREKRIADAAEARVKKRASEEAGGGP